MTSKNKRSNYDVLGLLSVVAILISYLWILTPNEGIKKEYSSFEDFYPFYLSQHNDITCRRLHFIGTSLLFALCCWEPSIILAIIVSLAFGIPVFNSTLHISHGLIEMIFMFATFQIVMRLSTKTWLKGLPVGIMAYGFAWIGHFYFELNKPATFIYPSYSLLGDFAMWYEIATGSIKF